MQKPDQLSFVLCDEFAKLLQAQKADDLILLTFVTEWAGPCNKFDIILDNAEKKIGDKCLFLYSDLDEDKDLGITYDCKFAPSFVLFRGGEIVAGGAGCITLPQLMEWIDIRLKILAKNS